MPDRARNSGRKNPLRELPTTPAAPGQRPAGQQPGRRATQQGQQGQQGQATQRAAKVTVREGCGETSRDSVTLGASRVTGVGVVVWGPNCSSEPLCEGSPPDFGGQVL